MKFLFDFFPILLFFIAYKVAGIYVATGTAIGASAIQVSAYWLKHRKFETMHLVTFALITVLGGATLLLHDRVFVMWKPTAVYWAFAVAFLASQYIGERKSLIERSMGHAISLPSPIWVRLNISWALFFIALGIANLYVANFFFQAEAALNSAVGHAVDLETCTQAFTGNLLDLCQRAQETENNWVNFKLFGMLGLTLLFIVLQAIYLARHIKEQPEETPAVSNETQSES